MSDLISRQAAIDAMNARLEDIKLTWRGKVKKGEIAMYLDMRGAIKTLPSAQPEIIRCRNCKHRPKFVKPEDEDDRGYLLFPDNKCPCRCEDEWYNWMPRKDWYCGNAERKE